MNMRAHTHVRKFNLLAPMYCENATQKASKWGILSDIQDFLGVEYCECERGTPYEDREIGRASTAHQRAAIINPEEGAALIGEIWLPRTAQTGKELEVS